MYLKYYVNFAETYERSLSVNWLYKDISDSLTMEVY